MPQDVDQIDNKKISKAGIQRDTSKATFNATLKNWDYEHIQVLIQELNDLLMDMVRMESENSVWINDACPSYRGSARNLLHYIALRQRDIRGLQHELASMGLSSLGRSESHIMSSILAVIRVLESLSGHDEATVSKLESPVDIRRRPGITEYAYKRSTRRTSGEPQRIHYGHYALRGGGRLYPDQGFARERNGLYAH